ncbi:MAG TPA: hypothetical protein VFG50_06915 [Rhodothermales bacterium]|nr:hypothetical protein [Rhodothermales bacterium]
MPTMPEAPNTGVSPQPRPADKEPDPFDRILLLATADAVAIACAIWSTLQLVGSNWPDVAATLILGALCVWYLRRNGETMPGRAFWRCWRQYM